MNYLPRMATLLLLSWSVTAHAVVIGNRDWRQVTDSRGISSAQLDIIYDRSTGRCDVEICQVGSIDFTDYVWAGNSEVDELFSYYTGDSLESLVMNSDYNVQASQPRLTDSFGATWAGGLGQDVYQVKGSTRDQNGGTASADVMAYTYQQGSQRELAFLGITYSADLAHQSIGAWVYRDLSPVPIPAAAWLFLSALSGLGWLKRKGA